MRSYVLPSDVRNSEHERSNARSLRTDCVRVGLLVT